MIKYFAKLEIRCIYTFNRLHISYSMHMAPSRAFKKHDTINFTPFKVCTYYFLSNIHKGIKSSQLINMTECQGSLFTSNRDNRRVTFSGCLMKISVNWLPKSSVCLAEFSSVTFKKQSTST